MLSLLPTKIPASPTNKIDEFRRFKRSPGAIQSANILFLVYFSVQMYNPESFPGLKAAI
jgi:hypothetical protein